MSDVIRSCQSLAQILDRLVEEASGETPASFAALAKAAGLDPARDFVGASLREIDLRNEDLREFDFSEADLVGADLRGANLEGVSFSGADTTGCLGLPRDLTADLVEPQVRMVFDPATYETRQNIKSVSVDIHRLNFLRLPDRLQGRVDGTVLRLHSIYQEIFNSSSTPSPDLVSRALHEFSTAASAFTEYLKEYERSPFQNPERDTEARYLFLMEDALCLYWRAFLTKVALKHEVKIKQASLDASATIREGLQRYVVIAKDSRFSNDAIVAFRLGNAMSLHGDSELALDRYREAVRYLAQSSLPSDHYMRVRLPRQLGIALWEAGEEIKRKTKTLGLGNTLNRSRLLYYLEALDVTKPLLGFTIGENAYQQQHKTEEENLITINNCLEYALSFLNAGGTWEELESHDFSNVKMETLLKDLLHEGLSRIDRPTMADTIRAVARYLGNGVLAKEAARRVIALIEGRDFTIPLSDEVYDEMRRDALAELGEGAT